MDNLQRFCYNCGEKIIQDNNFCTKCGVSTLREDPTNFRTSSNDAKTYKKLSTKKAVAIGKLVFFAFIIIGQIIVSSNSNPTKYKLGDYVWADGINYRVYQIGIADNHNIYDKPNGKYLKVYLTITDLENIPTKVYASNFFLIDEKGNRFSEATEYGYDSLLVTTLQPNLLTSAYVVFDIPSDSDPSNYYLEINDQNHLVKLSR